MACRANLSRERDRRGAAAATDIEDPFADLGFGPVDQDVRDRCKQDVLHLLPICPTLAGRSVPVCNLVGVLFMACRCIHVRGLAPKKSANWLFRWLAEPTEINSC